jgi:hypothetical protein
MHDEVINHEAPQCEIEEKAIDKQLAKGIWGGLLLIAIMSVISPSVYAKGGDTYGFLRTVFETGGPEIIKAVVGLGVWFILEYGLKGCWTRRIYDAEYGPTIIFAVFLYCVLR